MTICFYIACLIISLSYIVYRWRTQSLKEAVIDYDDLDLEYPANLDKEKHFLISIAYFLVGFSASGIILYFIGGLTVSLVGAVIGGWMLSNFLELCVTFLLNRNSFIK